MPISVNRDRQMKSLVFIIFCSLTLVDSAKILTVFPAPGYSQFILAENLVCELVARGHDVTLISAHVPKKCSEKCRTILVDSLVSSSKDENYFLLHGFDFIAATKFFHDWADNVTESILKNEGVQQFLHSKETFDLVLIERVGNEAHMAFARHFKAPLIIFSAFGPSECIHPLVGNINLPSIAPTILSGLSNSMNFYERFLSTIYTIYNSLYWNFVVLPVQQTFIDKYFPEKIDLSEIVYNTDLILVFSHPCTTEAFSLVSNIIEVGGFHIKPKPLPSDLQQVLDNSTDGFIFFSMGTNLNSKNFPEDLQKGMLKVFSKLKQKVIWKFESDLEDKPSNVFISKWLPQSDILGHPNIRLFISHGGLLSITEAVYNGVPMVGIPIFVDQPLNVARMVKHGVAKHLPFNEINEQSFENAIREVLDNPRYREEAKKRSGYMKDQLNSPMERAIYWIEYVIRHRGAPHLRAASVDLHWFQLYLLDVALTAMVIAGGLIFILRFALRRIFSNSPKNKSRSDRNCDKKEKIQ